MRMQACRSNTNIIVLVHARQPPLKIQVISQYKFMISKSKRLLKVGGLGEWRKKQDVERHYRVERQKGRGNLGIEDANTFFQYSTSASFYANKERHAALLGLRIE